MLTPTSTLASLGNTTPALLGTKAGKDDSHPFCPDLPNLTPLLPLHQPLAWGVMMNPPEASE